MKLTITTSLVAICCCAIHFRYIGVNLNSIVKRSFTLVILIALLTSCGLNSEQQISPVTPPLNPLTLLSNLSTPGLQATDVWGYVDPISNKEYALIGALPESVEEIGNVAIVDVSDPMNPQITSVVEDVIGSDMKVWGNYMYIANGGPCPEGFDAPFCSVVLDNPSRIVDLSDITNPVKVGTFEAAHNIFIDDKGYLYLAGTDSGTKIYNLNNDPENPTLVWDDTEDSDSHDVAIIRNKLYDFHIFDGTLVYNVSDPEKPVLLGTVPYEGFNHSGWVTDDDQYLFIMDESVLNTNSPPVGAAPVPFTSEVTVWDISDLDNPTEVGGIINIETRTHNVYIRGENAFMSYYNSGVRVYDISSPPEPTLLAEYDTNINGGTGIGNEFRGTWGIYPFLPSGIILASDIDNDLFILSYEAP